MNAGMSDEEYQRILAANPDWQAADEMRSDDLPESFGAAGLRGGSPAVAPARQPQIADAQARFFDKPDSEQYLSGDQKKAMKAQLYAYLADKMQRRGKVTSKPYYEKAEEAFAHQERVADANALGGLLLNAGDRAGTVLGRGPASNFDQFAQTLDSSRQNRINNNRALRGLEEQSNMDDLAVARYMTELERGDELRKDRREALYEQMRQRRDQNQMNQQKFGFEQRKQDEIERANRAREQIMRSRPPAIIGSPKYTPIATSEDGVILINPENPSDQRTVQLPKNFKPKGAPKPESSVDKPSADIAKNFEADFAKKSQIAGVLDRELAEYRRLRESGQEDAAITHGQGMLKGLNAAFGADAVGVEEADRIGGYLEPFKAPWKPGSMFKRDLDMFDQQVEAKSRAIKQAAQDSLLRAKAARKGGIDALIEPADGAPSGKDLNQMSLDELKAERDRLLKGGN